VSVTEGFLFWTSIVHSKGHGCIHAMHTASQQSGIVALWLFQCTIFVARRMLTKETKRVVFRCQMSLEMQNC